MIAAVLAFIDLFVEPHIAFNHTASMPPGFYWLRSVPVTGARSGDIVIACPPPAFAIYGRTHGFLDIGPCDGATTLIKRVAAMAGDRVHLGATGVRVNGHLVPNSAPLRRDARGALVPHIAYAAYVLRDHQLWLIGDDMHSFDSRYFGAIDRVLVIARPILTIDHLRSIAGPLTHQHTHITIPGGAAVRNEVTHGRRSPGDTQRVFAWIPRLQRF